MDKMARKIILSVALLAIFSLICFNEANSLAITRNALVEDHAVLAAPISSSGRVYSLRERRDANQRKSVQQLLQIVRAQNADGCVQKVICELSADINAHGGDGVRFGRSLLLLDGEADERTAQIYRRAATTGRALKNPRLCVNHYPSCVLSSPVLIKIANQVIDG